MRADRMTMALLKWGTLAAALSRAAVVEADERTDMWQMMGSTVRSEEKGDVTWFFVVAIVLVLAVFVYVRVYNRSGRRKTGVAKPKVAARSFSEHAGAMGFRPIEISNLRRIARRLSGGSDPVSVLATGSGRQFLTADLRRRVHRREKEIALLTGILQKLGARADHDFHERAGIRVEADIAIWMVRKSDDEPSTDDEVVVDIAPTSGRLVDLSEGGAAILATTDLVAGDVVEFWSADSQYWIPPTQSGVVSIRPAAAGKVSVSLHFLDPPLTEIRRVIQEIQRSEREDLEDPTSGPDGDSSNN